ncbi:class II D-tagatose-bisphosphate aldolase, non-catalytic subunit [Candidatus Kaiserbacteria bacterium]|nr:class II D-tagatose-bisphosphate aldolase, non-catalytic subunit [Candidatus Kaiserbacteria bacterium]
MAHRFNAKLAIGPMSSETIEATFRYSNFYRKELMLISTKNQIDWNGGYVNGWTTKEYMDYVQEMRACYPQAKVAICRDHCGPGFNGNHDIKDVYKTIEADIKTGFDLMHIDFCHFKGTKDEQFAASKKAVQLCLKLNPKIRIEIGTDENAGINYGLPNISEIEREINFFTSFCDPEFYVVQTGSLVMEINQVGSFNRPFVEKIYTLLQEKGLKMKEHNADYLPKAAIAERDGIVDTQNIAPQLGVIQTQHVLTKCLIYGVDPTEFLDTVYAGGKWKKWMRDNTKENKMLCSVIAGHYHFASDAYKRLVAELGKHEDISESIMTQLGEVIHHYVGE